MKTILVRLSRNILFGFLPLLFAMIGNFAYSQPTWGPVAAVNVDNTFTIAGSSAVVNCDMYTDMETGSPTEYVTAIAWSHRNGSTHEVWLRVMDHFSGTVFNIQIAVDAVSPDVIIGDDGSGISGNLKIAVVYRDISSGNDVQYVEIPFTGMCNPSGGAAPSHGPTSAPLQLNTNTASVIFPHIDAYPDPAPSYWGVGNSYRALNKFAIAWDEQFGSKNEVWLASGDLTLGVTATNKIADGTAPDIAAAYDVPNTREIAYIVYNDFSSGDLTLMHYNISSSTPIGTSTLETSPHGLQRIDAANVQNTVAIPWVAVAQLGSGSSATIRSYDPGGTFDFALYSPISSGAAGFKPVVATGPGPDDYNGLTGEFGNNKYLEAFTMDIAEFEAVDYDATAGTWGGYYEVNTTAMSTMPVVKERRGRAVATSSNCGVGHLVAWVDDNGTNNFIGWKVNTGTTASFKPGRPASIVRTEGNEVYSAYPNPTTNVIGVRGLKAEAQYKTMDVTGKTVLSGTVRADDAKIDVSTLSPGVYIFSFNENGEEYKLKFVKE